MCDVLNFVLVVGKKEVPTLKVGVLACYFCRKRHENERIGTPGRGLPWRPLGSANDWFGNKTGVSDGDSHTNDDDHFHCLGVTLTLCVKAR